MLRKRIKSESLVKKGANIDWYACSIRIEIESQIQKRIYVETCIYLQGKSGFWFLPSRSILLDYALVFFHLYKFNAGAN